MDRLFDKLGVLADKLSPEYLLALSALFLAGFLVFSMVQVIKIIHKK